jgi:probable DNA repair protein
MYQWLSEAAENNSVVITASRRLARVLNTEFGKQQLARGHKAWLSPNIKFLDDWLSSIVNSTPDSLPIVLNGHASSVIWERCLKGQTGDQLLNLGGLVKQARQSRQRLYDWQVSLDEVSSLARSQDERLFAAAAHQYRSVLEDNHWLDAGQLTDLVAELFANGMTPAPDRIVHAGFDRLEPTVENLFAGLAEAGCQISAAPSDTVGADITVLKFDDVQAELRAAGAWARHELAENPGSTIGIISSSLDRDGVASERLIREGLAPGWQYGASQLRSAVNTSYGRRLSEYPSIAIALILLQWVYRNLSFAEISLLLRTPFFSAPETSGRSKLELYLRRLPDQPWTASSIIRLFRNRLSDADAINWIEAIERLASFRKEADGKANPVDWAAKIDSLLCKLGWPGSKMLDSDEFQLLNRWRELLNDLARLSIVCPTMTFSEACSRLGALANDTIYQPESKAAAVQLLGPLEAAGMRFDSLWISGLDADSWPPAAHPLSLVSRSLQRQHSMPDATPDDTLEYSRRVLNRLLCSSDRIRLSWPRSSSESDNTVSPLLAAHAGAEQDTPADPGWHASGQIGSANLVSPADDPVPPVGKDEIVGGGAYTVQLQATEPFSAFAHGRLRASRIDSVATGLSPLMRGSLIHTALNQLLNGTPSQNELRDWLKADAEKRIRNAVDSALKKYSWHADPVLNRILALERDRLRDLLLKFIEVELERPAFQVDKVELEIEYQHAGVRLRLRVDRIDRLSDGELLVADYKTGQAKNFLKRSGEPHDLQLIVYACALGESIGGLVLINIDSRSIVYSGAGANVPWDRKRADQWPQRLTAWQEKVASAMRQIAMGDVRINLSLPSDKTRPLSILSRFEERSRG